ncbi:unnamed protein product [Caenorhabditis sp. 36 PRJEB53466]|nr:unnamed protein product [Caenorhabditis sp. 36 PRJEB53466]
MTSSSASLSSLNVTSRDEKSPKSVSPDGGAQRFFGQGKRIPKDVKRHCGMCKQHGLTVETRGHTCEYKNCNCEHCDLVRRRREIMSTQIRLRREQDKKFQRTTDINEANVFPGCNGMEQPDEKTLQENLNMCYFCQKCKNHSVLVWKKNHKKECRYANCECEQCGLIDSRRALDRHIKKRRMSMKASTGGTAPKSPKKEMDSSANGSFSSLSSVCNSDESSSSSSSSDCSLSGLLSEKLNVAPQVHVKFDFSTGGFITPVGQQISPVSSPYESTPSPCPLILPRSPMTSTIFPTSVPPLSSFLSVPSFLPTTTSCASSPFLSNPFLYSNPTFFSTFANPFLMSMTPLEMQMLFQNIQCMTAAVSLGNKD